MRRLLPVVSALWALSAVADIVPPNLADCAGKADGAPCKLDDGSAGTCVATQSSRPDYSSGIPPKRVPVTVMVCKPAVAAAAKRVPAAAWLFAAALATAGLLALGARRFGAAGLRPT